MFLEIEILQMFKIALNIRFDTTPLDTQTLNFIGLPFLFNQ